MWLEVSFTKFALAVARRMEQGVGKVPAVPGPVGGAWAVVQEGADEGLNWASWTEGEVGVELEPWGRGRGRRPGPQRSLWPKP